MFRFLGLITACCGFLFTSTLSVATEPRATITTLSELKAAIEDTMVKHEVPAVGIAMVDETGPVWVGSLGKADIATGTVADASTMYRIGSISKMFVSLSVLKLVEEGRLSLDDKLSDLAPEIFYDNPWEDTDPIRMVHLLEHTTGWDDNHLPQFALSDPTISLKDGLDYHPHSRSSRWKPGTRMAYCNAGPPLAAYIVQKITGQNFEEYVADQFFRPLGMNTVTYRLNDDVMQHGVSLYANDQRLSYQHISLRPSGAINISPEDMAKFVAFFVNRGRGEGRALLSPASLARMERSTSTSGAKAGLELGYGLSNYSSIYKHWVYREHRGAVNGARSTLAYLPEANAGHAIMINAGNYAALREISQLVRAYETRDLTPPSLEPRNTLALESTTIEGFYMPINPRREVTHFIQRVVGIESIRLDGNRLAREPLLGGVPEYYYPLSENLFRPDGISQAGLVITSDPLAGDIIQADSLTYQPVSAAAAFSLLGTGGAWLLYIASSLLFFPIWGVRRLRGNISAGLPTRVRVWPLLSSICIVTTVLLFRFAASSNPIDVLARPSLIAVAIMVATALFAVFSVVGLYAAYRARSSEMNQVAYWHSALGALLHGTVMVYLLYYGVIGLRTWA
ncbi:hypothetical protein AWR36_011170 [Microbulbifer flavimaris]|uniref:Beta-lactamase-related domain-containing protein n=1 Tax=Microbulbifer flavimaris TaxID=1781068 RepID=A0ABX4HYV0_9GAMM|nr:MULTISPECIES: serine hydrolase domain-containing protein [Microbulbifer]PCO05274.1 hypothetical protein AWR36_011170 [Microbulbifer flavimaris]